MNVTRIIAICIDGPAKGQYFSVALNENGTPPALESRADIFGVLYKPANEIIPVPKELFEQFDDMEHELVYEYVSE